MPRRSVNALQSYLDRKFGEHSLPRLKVAIYASGIEMCRLKLQRLRLLTLLVGEASLARRVEAFEHDLLDKTSEEDVTASINVPRLLAQLRAAETAKPDTDWKRVVQLLYAHPTIPDVRSTCLRILQRCLTNTSHKRAVVMAGGVRAIVVCLEHLTSTHEDSRTTSFSSPSHNSAAARMAVELLLRLPYTQGDAGHYDRCGVATGRARDDHTLHLPIVELLTRAGTWEAISRAARSNALEAEYDTEEGYERQLARQNIESTCRGLQLSATESLSDDVLQKRVSFVCTCVASLLDDPSIGEPLGSILKQH